LADLLQGLSLRFILPVLLCCSAAVAGSPHPFSHQQHWKLELDCLTCHASIATSTQLGDNNLPSQEICLRCHQEVSIKTPRSTILARFSHQKHLELGNIASVMAATIDQKTYLSPPGDIRRHLNSENLCVACHRGLEESDAVSRSVFPQMADCLVCHSKIEPPFSCEFCHPPGPELKPASHTPNYLDLHSSEKAMLDKQSCAVCHGRRFTCRGCH
jgi:hypothetical protein